MIHREHGPRGTWRVRTDDCSFSFTRLRPGTLHVVVVGEDDGAFGTAVLDEFDAECERFGVPLELFVDALGVARVSTVAADRWTAWFERRRADLARVCVLTRSKTMTLTVSIARHLSRTDGLFEITADAVAFERSMLAKTSAGRAGIVDTNAIERAELEADAIEWRSPACTFRVEPIASGRVLLTVRGTDDGSFGTAVIDEIRAIAASHGQPVELFVDADVDAIEPGARALWMAWLGGDTRHVRKVTMFVPSKSTRLSIAFSREQSRTVKQIQFVDDRATVVARSKTRSNG